MPIIVAGGDSGSASPRDLAVFSLCTLIDKRDASKRQLNVIAFAIFCSVMAGWALKISLGSACLLLCISVSFALYALYSESRTLRQIQRELLGLLRNTPQSDIEEFFSDAVRDLHED